ncbi:hypothetical protein [Amycolatopsis lexingtonensis]|uniref:hypothetical protein n=1 Tax=Amycolatopsis lexingtonensis TaxID=218822 RepID=UPI003F6F047B
MDSPPPDRTPGGAGSRPVANQVDGDVDGQVVQVGVVHGDVHVNGRARIRTRYRQQVLQRIAPPRLLEREAELAELAEFCTSPESAGAYRWWRAGAWSGKSALMSWFALNPPQGVELVSFFVTARLAGQNDRSAFIDNVMEQLLALLGEDLPAFLTDTTREAHLLGLLQDAAEACRRRGDTFVLLIDGLDEDRGAGIDPDAHSIAALLPARPPAGMRVIVAGRPHPPVPSDVPRHHPLRDPAIVRTLQPSPHALSAQAEMQRELKRLMRGTPIEQSLLGLVTAAGGGLTAADLAHLTGQPEWEIDDHLATVAGRSFTKREGADAPVYLLGHEELQLAAIAMLGPARLAGHRDTLHRWAEDHRALGWPEATPRYLLRGYFTMLTATSDLQRMVACATDLARHDRMLDVSGGDALALAEITTTQNVILAQSAPDLVAMTRLSIHRDHLSDRNSHIPPLLPELWARLGQINRAESIASSIVEPADRVFAMTAVARIAEARGETTRAAEIFAAAEAVAVNILHPERRAAALAASRRREHVATEPQVLPPSTTSDWVTAIVQLVRAHASFSHPHRARTLVDGVADAGEKRAVLDALAHSARTDPRVREMFGGDEGVVVPPPAGAPAEFSMGPNRFATIESVSRAVTRVGRSDPRRAGDLLVEAEALAVRAEPRELIALARAWFALGTEYRVSFLLAEAEGAVRRTSDGGKWVSDLAAVARAAVEFGRRDRAESLLAQTEMDGREHPDPVVRVLTLVAVAQARLESGASEQAASLLAEVEKISRSIIDPARRIRVIAELTRAAVRAGRVEAVRGLLIDVEEVAAKVTADWAVAGLVRAVAASGDIDRAARIAGSRRSSDVARAVVLGLVDAHDTGAAVEAAGRLPRDERSVPPYVTVIEAALEQGDGRAIARAHAELSSLAEALPPSVTSVKAHLALVSTAVHRNVESEVDYHLRSAAREASSLVQRGGGHVAVLARVAQAAADTGRQQLAAQLIERAEEAAGNDSAAGATATFLALARFAHRTGQFGRAEEWLARAESNAAIVESDRSRITNLAATAHAAHEIGSAARSRQLLDDAERAARALSPAVQRDWALVNVLDAALLVGDHPRAVAIAGDMEYSTQLIVVFLAIARCDRHPRRDWALARALQITRWYKRADELVRADASILDAIVAELAAITGRG